MLFHRLEQRVEPLGGIGSGQLLDNNPEAERSRDKGQALHPGGNERYV